MSKVIAIMSMSLDGFVADSEDGVADVLGWYFTSGDVEFRAGGASPMSFRVSEPSANHLQSLWSELGAIVTGRKTFEVANGWGGRHAWGPAFVVTHQAPAGWPIEDSDVTFVTDGVERAVELAKVAAGGKSVGMHGPDVIQQCLRAGLLDELSIDLVPTLLGSGVRLFDSASEQPVRQLGKPQVIVGNGVTHLRYPVVKV